MTLGVFGRECKLQCNFPADRSRLCPRQANKSSQSLHLGSQFFPRSFVTHIMIEILTPLFANEVGLGLVEEWTALHKCKLGDCVRWHQRASEEKKCSCHAPQRRFILQSLTNTDLVWSFSFSLSIENNCNGSYKRTK